MASAVDISSYLELMDHEFGGIDIKPSKQGYRVDRGGIKAHCAYPNLKSVDYFHGDNGEMVFIEFSDLAKQHLSILESIEQFKKCNLDKCIIRRNVKRLHREIAHELKQKYMDSLVIIRKVPKVFEGVPDWMRVEAGKVVIVVAPTEHGVDEAKKQDVVRVLEKLKDDLACSIPDEFFVHVKVVQVDSFFQ